VADARRRGYREAGIFFDLKRSQRGASERS
jgi:hypothetical protein